MRNLALSVALIAGLFLPIGAIHAQSTETVTATCKDGTAFTGTKRSGACRGPAPAPATSQRAAPSLGSAGQVWVNTASKVYHCPGTRWYGKTNQGGFMSETQALAQGARSDHGKACTGLVRITG
jgi:hypothetical protein